MSTKLPHAGDLDHGHDVVPVKLVREEGGKTPFPRKPSTVASYAVVVEGT